MEQKVLKDFNLADKSLNNKHTSKSVQYFTVGKDNCLIQHPASHTKKSSPNAVFCKADPFKMKHKKVKFTLPSSRAQSKYSAATKKPHREAISKLATNLKQVNAALSPNSDIFSTIIEGKSVNLNPRTGSCSETASYCERIKRCKMCGEVMLGCECHAMSHTKKSYVIPLTYADYGSNTIQTFGHKHYTDPVSSTTLGQSEEKSKREPHKHNAKIKRCVICSKFFIQPYDSSSCEDCPSNERFNAKQLLTQYEGPTTNMQPSSTKIPSQISSSTPVGHQTNKYKDTKSSQSAKSNNFPDKSNCSKDRVNPKVSSQSNPFIRGQYLSNGNNVIEKKRGTKATIDSIARSLSERNQAASRPKSITEKLSSESHTVKKQSNKNISTTKDLSKVVNKPSIPKTKPLKTRLQSILEENASRSNFNESHSKHINTESSRAPGIPRQNMSSQTQLLFEANPHITNTSSITSEEISSDSICIDQVPSNRSSNDMMNVLKQAKSLPNIDLATTTTSPERIPTQETQVDEEETVCKSVSAPDILHQNISLPDANQVTGQSKESSKNVARQSFDDTTHHQISNMVDKGTSTDTNQVIDKSKEPSKNVNMESSNDKIRHQKSNMANKSTSTEKLNEVVWDGPLSQTEEELLSKFAKMLSQNKDSSSNYERRPTRPILQNVTVNNYYFVSQSDLKRDLCNSSMTHVPSNISVISDNEDGIDVNKVTHDNILNISSLKAGLSNCKLLAKLLAKQNNNGYLYDMHNSQGTISLYNDTCSDLKSDYLKSSERYIYPNDLHHNILGQMKLSKNSHLSSNKQCQQPNLDCQSLYAINPYIQKSLRIFQEMERVRNEPIDQQKIMEELKKNKDLMEIIDKMATKKLNFSRKSTVFKNITSE